MLNQIQKRKKKQIYDIKKERIYKNIEKEE